MSEFTFRFLLLIAVFPIPVDFLKQRQQRASFLFRKAGKHFFMPFFSLRHKRFRQFAPLFSKCNVHCSAVRLAWRAHDASRFLQFCDNLAGRARLYAKILSQLALGDFARFVQNNQYPLLASLALIQIPHNMIDITQIYDELFRNIRFMILSEPVVSCMSLLVMVRFAGNNSCALVFLSALASGRAKVAMSAAAGAKILGIHIIHQLLFYLGTFRL